MILLLGLDLDRACFILFQILVNDQKVATGVEAERFGQKLSFKVKKEVILSAGGISSPQILLLSGIGPRQEHFSTLNEGVFINYVMQLRGVAFVLH